MLTLCSQPAVLFISLLALWSSISSSTPSKHQFTHWISYAALSRWKHVGARRRAHRVDMWGLNTSLRSPDESPSEFRWEEMHFFSLPLVLSHFLHSHVLVVETMSQLTETQFFSLCIDITHSRPPLTFVWPVIHGAFTNVLNQCGTFSTLHQCFCSSTYSML